MKKRFVKRLFAGLLTVSVLVGTAAAPLALHAQEKDANASQSEWEALKAKLETYGGVWEDNTYMGAITDVIPRTALMGNGDVGITSYGNSTEKTYLISKGDFWNCGDLKTSAPFSENDRTRRPLTVGGLTLRELTGDEEPEKLIPIITACGEIVGGPDNYAISNIMDGKMEAEDETWACNQNHGTAGHHWFQVDLQKSCLLSSYTIYHQGAYNGQSHFNTSDYIVKGSLDGEHWEELSNVVDNEKNKNTVTFPSAKEVRYIRVEITNPAVNGNKTARIPEMTLSFGSAKITVDACGEIVNSWDNYAKEAIIDGKMEGENDEWACNGVHDTPGHHYFTIDFGENRKLKSYILYHQGAYKASDYDRNTRDYTIWGSTDKENWELIEKVEGNTENIRRYQLDTAMSVRYVKMDITDPATRNGDNTVRLPEMELYDANNVNIITGKKVSAAQFLEKQNITNGEISTSMAMADVPVTINTWISATANMMVTKLESNGTEAVEMEASVWTKADGSTNYAKESGVKGNVAWATRATYNAAKENPESWTSKVAVASTILGKDNVTAKVTGQASSRLEFTLNPGESICILTAIGGGGQTYNNKDELQTEEPLKEAENILKAYGTQEDVASLWKAHNAWWKDYWLKSFIDIGDEAVHKYYYGSLYYMGCTARANTQAPGLYGVWITTDHARYQDDYHMNYNYMAPFYGMYSSNRYEGAYSLLSPIQDYAAKAEWAAKNSLARLNSAYVAGRADLANGIDDALLYPVGLAPWGQYTEDTYFGQTLNTLFAATVFMSYYNYTQDKVFLEKEAWPFLKKVANFYTHWCEKEDLGNGDYRYNLWDGAHENWFDKNAGVSLGITKAVYEFMLKQAKQAGASEAEVAQWQDMYDHLADVPVRTYTKGEFSKPIFALTEEGSILESGQATVNMEFVQPGDQLSFDSDPELLEIGRNSIEAKVVANANIWGQMNNTSKIYVHAIRVGYDPAEVLRQFKKTNIDKMEKNFTIQDQNHGIEKAGGIEFINNMLLQSTQGIMKVFPNWTGADASFTTLREKGAFLVSSKLADGKVQFIEITSEAGKEASVVNPWGDSPVTVKDSHGKVISYKVGNTTNTKEKTIVFATKENETYTITEGGVLEETFETTFVVDDKSQVVETKAGEKIKMPAEPQKEGYLFKGWYTKEDGGEKVTDFTKTQTVYAQWEKEAVDKPDEGQGGTQKPADQGSAPKTGDNAVLVVLFCMVGICVAFVAVFCQMQRRRRCR